MSYQHEARRWQATTDAIDAHVDDEQREDNDGTACSGLAQVPGEVGGEHADQHVALDAFPEAVEDGAEAEAVGLNVPEVVRRT